MAVSKTVANPVRTAGQLAVATAVIEFVDAVVYDMTDRAYMASIGLLVILISGLQVAAENKFGLALFRKADSARVPVIDKVGGDVGA